MVPTVRTRSQSAALLCLCLLLAPLLRARADERPLRERLRGFLVAAHRGGRPSACAQVYRLGVDIAVTNVPRVCARQRDAVAKEIAK